MLETALNNSIPHWVGLGVLERWWTGRGRGAYIRCGGKNRGWLHLRDRWFHCACGRVWGLWEQGVGRRPVASQVGSYTASAVLPPLDEVERQAAPPGLLVPAMLLLESLLQGCRWWRGRLSSRPSHFSHIRLIVDMIGGSPCLYRLSQVLAGILCRWVLGHGKGQREVESVGDIQHSWGAPHL